MLYSIPVVKIAEKSIYRSVFWTILHCILSAELTKTHSFRLFFVDFAHWDVLFNGEKRKEFS